MPQEYKDPQEINTRLFNLLIDEGLIKKHEDQLIQSVDIKLRIDNFPKIKVKYEYCEKK